MYVSAQRVCSPSREGVNAFLSLHAEPHLEEVDWNDPPLKKLVDEQPGILLFQDCDLTPGGNHVRSFLDVVAKNHTPVAQITAALQAMVPAVARSLVPFAGAVDGVAVRFDGDAGLVDDRADEYRLLARRIVRLLEGSLNRAPASAAE